MTEDRFVHVWKGLLNNQTKHDQHCSLFFFFFAPIRHAAVTSCSVHETIQKGSVTHRPRNNIAAVTILLEAKTKAESQTKPNTEKFPMSTSRTPNMNFL